MYEARRCLLARAALQDVHTMPPMHRAPWDAAAIGHSIPTLIRKQGALCNMLTVMATSTGECCVCYCFEMDTAELRHNK